MKTKLRVRTNWNNNGNAVHIQMEGEGEYANRDYGYATNFHGHPKIIEWLKEQEPTIPSLNSSDVVAYIPAKLFIYDPDEDDEEGEYAARILMYGTPKNHLLGALVELDVESNTVKYLTRFAIDNDAEALSWVHSIEEKLKLCTVVELKRRLKNSGLPVGGKKADLVKRLLQEMIRLAQGMSEE